MYKDTKGLLGRLVTHLLVIVAATAAYCDDDCVHSRCLIVG